MVDIHTHILPAYDDGAADVYDTLEMLRIADVAVCPANAIDAVKEVCDLCLCDHDLGVLADLVELLSEG